MAAHVLTLQFPAPLYTQLKERAKCAQRSLEAEFLVVVETVLGRDEELPEVFGKAIREVEILDEEESGSAARTRLHVETRARFDALNLKRQSEGLIPSDQAEQEHLPHQSDRTMPVRANAVRLLERCGHDVHSPPLTFHSTSQTGRRGLPGPGV